MLIEVCRPKSTQKTKPIYRQVNNSGIMNSVQRKRVSQLIIIDALWQLSAYNATTRITTTSWKVYDKRIKAVLRQSLQNEVIV